MLNTNNIVLSYKNIRLF